LRPAGVDDHVPGLAGEAVRAPLEHAPGDVAAADAGAEGDEHRLGGAPGGAELELGPHRRGRVVVDDDRHAQQRLELASITEVDDPGEVGPDAQHTSAVDEPGDPDADGVGTAHVGHGSGDGVEDEPPATGRRQAQVAIRVAGDDEDLGAPDIDPDRAAQ
jgi:hypothetical protein